MVPVRPDKRQLSLLDLLFDEQPAPASAPVPGDAWSRTFDQPPSGFKSFDEWLAAPRDLVRDYEYQIKRDVIACQGAFPNERVFLEERIAVMRATLKRHLAAREVQ